ncbi:ribonuclease E inhibitor RraB [Rossellomorea sp. y25]|uniref:ribonuclease E inhibitor RraB n=1 Tax=Rossellomorea sp. y25 TaxID=3118174 RepID=UPI0030DE5F72
MKFPNDDDGQVLEMLYKEGLDFSKKHRVDFFVSIPDKKNGEALLNVLSSKGFNCELEKDDDSNDWTCYCYVSMLLEYEAIINIQNQLQSLSLHYEGYSDGWGVLAD